MMTTTSAVMFVTVVTIGTFSLVFAAVLAVASAIDHFIRGDKWNL